MNAFLREHAAPLAGAAVLHAALVAFGIWFAWWTVSPRITPPAAIDAYLAPPLPVRHAPIAAETIVPTPATAAPETPAVAEPPKPAPKSDVPPAKPDDIVLKVRKAAEEKARAERKAEEAAAARRAAEKQRAAEEEKRRAAEEEKRRAAAAADAQRKAAAHERAARESDLDKQLAAEEHRLGAENAGLLGRYISELQARIERAWNRPPTARTGLHCTVFVTQVPGGTVTDVRLGDCNGDAAVQQSITLAVFRASPLPAPPDPSLFERNLRLVFAPDE